MTSQRPPVFTRLDLGAALERSRTEHKLLLVDATAPWCGPCQLMDRTTWLDTGVVAWIETHAIAFQLDVDAHGAAAKQLSVDAMPTIIVFRDGDEVDRMVGFQKPEDLLTWLSGLARGVTSLDVKRGEIAVNPNDAALRLEHARMLVAANRLDDATSEYVWLWNHAREHVPVYAEDLWRIAGAHPPARVAIAKLRDELEPTTAPSLQDLRDWLLLNDVLGEARLSLQWFDACYRSPPNQHEVADLVEKMIGPLLLGANRWRDARMVYGKQLWRKPLRDLVRTWKAARQRLR